MLARPVTVLSVRGIVAVLLLMAASAFGCTDRPGTGHYAELLDELAVPPGWTLAAQRTREPGSSFVSCEPRLDPSCPSVHRYYLVPGAPADAYRDAERMATGSGFAIVETWRPYDCDGGETGGRACSFLAVRGTDLVGVYLSDPGEDAGDIVALDGQFVITVVGQHNTEGEPPA